MLRHMLLLVDRLDAELLEAHDLSLASYEILVVLAEEPAGTMRMNQLADRALISRSRLTHLVDRLVERGLVERRPCPSDRRGVNAVLTADGRALLEAAAPTHVAGVRHYVIDPLDPEVLQTLRRDLEPVLAELEADGAQANCPAGDAP
jgi:DNA-binding MarR family transcriptional regulator